MLLWRRIRSNLLQPFRRRQTLLVASCNLTSLGHCELVVLPNLFLLFPGLRNFVLIELLSRPGWCWCHFLEIQVCKISWIQNFGNMQEFNLPFFRQWYHFLLYNCFSCCIWLLYFSRKRKMEAMVDSNHIQQLLLQCQTKRRNLITSFNIWCK